MSRDHAAAGHAGPIRLGLIGDNIAASRSPELHRLCGDLCGLDVSYERIVPPKLGVSFKAALEMCRQSGMRGVNVTYPYKEGVVPLLSATSASVAQIGSANTVVFSPAGATGHNTDHSGFIAAWRTAFGDAGPGAVALIGAGGVGRAIGFALAALGASALTIFDADMERAEGLESALGAAGVSTPARISTTLATAVKHVEGVANGTPVGMVGTPGSPVPRELLGPQRWAFDAVYTPRDTLFLRQAREAGLTVLDGYELFFHQGIAAFELFTGHRPDDLGAVRRGLAANPEIDERH
jgi:shikimate dehydrogenase